MPEADQFSPSPDTPDWLKGAIAKFTPTAPPLPPQAPKPISETPPGSPQAQLSPQSTGKSEPYFPIPSGPKLQDMPKAPTPQFESPLEVFNVFKNPAIVLAAIGSVFTRQPLTTAFKVAQGSVEGFNKGQIQKSQQEFQKWKAATEQAMEQNNKEIEKYKVAMDIRDMKARMAAMSTIAAANNDPIMQAFMHAGDYDGAWKMFFARQNMQLKMEGMMAGIQARQEVQANTQTSLPPATVEFMAQQGIAGDQSWKTGLGRGIQGAADIRAVEKRMQELNAAQGRGGAEQAQANVMLGAEKGAARSVLTRVENLENILNTVKTAAPAAIAASDAVERYGGGWVPVNEAIQRAQTKGSNIAFKNFAVKNIQLAELWARAMNPQGVMRIEDRSIALDILNKADSKETYRAAVESIIDSINREKAGARATIQEMSGPAGGLTPSMGPSVPQPGAIEDGHRFKGGNPGDKGSWEPL